MPISYRDLRLMFPADLTHYTSTSGELPPAAEMLQIGDVCRPAGGVLQLSFEKQAQLNCEQCAPITTANQGSAELLPRSACNQTDARLRMRTPGRAMQPRAAEEAH